MEQVIASKSRKKILVREPRDGDVDELMTLMNEVIEEDVYIMVNEKQTRENEVKYIASVLKDVTENRMIKLFAFDGETMIGQADVKRGRYRSGHTGLFGIILKNGYRNDGIGRQLAEAVIKLARERMGTKLVELHVYSENEPARNLYKKLGFVECGVLPEAVEYRGRMLDQIHMYRKLL